MKKLTKVLMFAALILAVAGIVCIAAGSVLGGDMKGMFRSLTELDEDELFTSVTAEQVKDKTTEFPLVYSQDEVSYMEIEMAAGELEILVSEDENIYVHSSSQKNLIKLEQECLHVESKGIIPDNKIQIYLPDELSLREADIELESGEAVIDNIYASETNLEVQSGSILVTGSIEADSFSGNVEAGKIEIGFLDAGIVDLECEAGELLVTLAGTEADYKGQAICDMGTLVYGTEDWSGMDISEHIGNSGERYLEAECEAGTLKISFNE